MMMKVGTVVCQRLSAALLFCACSLLPGTVARAAEELLLPPAELPVYHVGSKFVYSDGSWQRVEKIGQGWLRLLNHRGEITVQSVDFTYRPFHWEAGNQKLERRFTPTRFMMRSTSDSLWPLLPANTVYFTETGEWPGGNGPTTKYSAQWRCRVVGTTTAAVGAGTFDSWRVGCTRFSKEGGNTSASEKILEEVNWRYVPALQHWVSRETTREQNKMEVVELVAILPDLQGLGFSTSEAAEMRSQFQDILDRNRRGEQDLWMKADGSRTVAMTPGPAFRRPGGSLCRQYQLEIRTASSTGQYPGIACQNPGGIWQIPRW